MIRARHGTMLVVALALGACASLTKKEPFTTYAPRYVAPAAATNVAPVEWQLAIDTPLASDALDTPRMLVMPSPGVLETYKGARWSDTTPMLLRSLLIAAFQQSNRIAGVGASTTGLHADYALSIDLYDFETQYRDGAAHATIRLDAKLTDLSANRIAAARAFEADAPVGGSGAADAAAGFNAALAELLPQMVGWTLEQGQARWGSRGADAR